MKRNYFNVNAEDFAEFTTELRKEARTYKQAMKARKKEELQYKKHHHSYKSGVSGPKLHFSKADLANMVD